MWAVDVDADLSYTTKPQSYGFSCSRFDLVQVAMSLTHSDMRDESAAAAVG